MSDTASDTDAPFGVGDWVMVYAQVVEGITHPEDTLVRLESHSEHYEGHVRRDRVVVPAKPPGFVPACTSLFDVRVMMPSSAGAFSVGALIRCWSHDGHSGDHQNGEHRWSDSNEYGNVEDNTYRH